MRCIERYVDEDVPGSMLEMAATLRKVARAIEAGEAVDVAYAVVYQLECGAQVDTQYATSQRKMTLLGGVAHLQRRLSESLED